MALTVAQYSQDVKDGKVIEYYKIYQISNEDYTENLEDVAATLEILLEKIDFNITTGDSDNTTQSATALLTKSMALIKEFTRKQKDVIFNVVISVLNKVKDKPINNENSPASKLIDSSLNVFQMEFISVKKSLVVLAPIINDILKQKKINKNLISKFQYPVMQIQNIAPEEFANLGPAIIKLAFVQEVWQYLSSIPNLYGKYPKEIDEHVPLMIELLKEGNQQVTAHLPMILQKVAEKNPGLLSEHIQVFMDEMNSQYYYVLYAQILDSIGKQYVKSFTPHLPKLKQLYIEKDIGIVSSVGHIFTAYYRDSTKIEEIKEIYELHFTRLNKDPDMYKASMLVQVNDFSKCSDLHKKVLRDNYRPKLDEMLKIDAAKAMVQAIINYLEDRTLEKMDQRIDVQDQKITKVEEDVKVVKVEVKEVKEDVKKLDTRLTNLEEVVENHKKWVAENLDNLRNSMAKLGKVLPVPVDMTIKYQGIDTISLHFICAYHKDEQCMYPGPDAASGKTFTTETKQVNRWLKIGVQAVSLGLKIFNGDIYGGISNIKNMWDAFNERPEEKFDTFSSEPFLTSEEQDELIIQLRKSTFYAEFGCDPGRGGWSCNKCLGKEVEPKEPEEKTGMEKVTETVEKKKETVTLVVEQVQELQDASGCSCTIL